MANISIDLTNFKDRFGGRATKGDHLATIEDIELGKTKKGDAMLTVFLRIIGGEDDGTNIVDRLTMSDAAMFRVVGFLQGLGIPTPRKKLQIDPARIVGRKVTVTLDDGDPYNGTVRSEVRQYTRFVQEGADEVADLPEDLDEPAELPEPEAPATNDSIDVDLDDMQL